MKIEIIGKKCTPHEPFRARAEKKLAKVERLFGSDTSAKIVATVEKTSKSVEITLQKHGIIFRAQERATELDAALDKAVDALVRQIRKNKTRLEKKLQSPSIGEVFAEEAPIDEHIPEVLRTKQLSLKPESVDEAILQMSLLGHDFYMFLNADNMQVSVVYNRADGGYGLLVPDVA
ncbi:MAG: ribosome-associated translation inhibitor RaiA [Oscillospiraceae bacterium]|nr:ribosome-associated translation inhibitor RaiA [Oscillospiraceae bacterium]